MALDTLRLGPFTFEDFAVPNRLPFGGNQKTVVHKMPGGGRVIDCLGPDDDDRTWSGIFMGADALRKAQTLDALRISGAALPYSNGVEARIVVIASFSARVRKFNVIEYTITVTPSDNPAAAVGGIASLIGQIRNDLGSAVTAIAGAVSRLAR